MKTDFNLSPNKVVKTLKKHREDIRKGDIIAFVKENEIRMINFMYPADDGRLKTLNFVVNSEEYLNSILTYGERVDGSSLFPFIEAGNSDLYVVPKYASAFVDPFSEIPTLVMLAEFFDKDGKPLDSSPQNTLRKACSSFRQTTGMEFFAMGELEYYVIAGDNGMFPATDQKGYHESAPFAKFNDFRMECMDLIAQAGGEIKYGHSEVGNFSLDGNIYEQNEIEFLPVYAEDAASQLMIAKWIIRTNAMRRGFDVTFAPKITEGKAGSGLHIHFKIMKNGKNMMTTDKGLLSDTAKKSIVGILENAESITAMGNRVPTSYFRLVPHQEAPTSICWGDRNRSVLVRVPLGWTGEIDLCSQVNPLETESHQNNSRQTVELRSADCSANIYQLLAAMIVGAREGFLMENALERAEDLYVSVNIHCENNQAKLETLRSLPDSCVRSAEALEMNRSVFEKDGVFNPAMIDAIIESLTAFHDEKLRQELEGDRKGMLELVRKYWNC